MCRRQVNLFQWMIVVSICIGVMGSGDRPLHAVKLSMPPVSAVNKKPVPSLMTAMVLVPALEITKMPFGEKNALSPVNIPNFLIGKTEVTGKLWKDVYDWAVRNKYVFENAGENLGTTKPVTRVSWYDVVVWCNAYSQKEGLNPVYRDKNGNILRNAKNREALDSTKQSPEKNNGYHLPTSMQWEMAARWLGTTKPKKGSLKNKVISTLGPNGKKYYWTPEPYLSGASENFRNIQESNKVAWFASNNKGTAQSVCRKWVNALLMCDVSGNVSEWLYDKKDIGGSYYSRISSKTNSRETRGGDWLSDGPQMTVSSADMQEPDATYSMLGFRLAKTAKK